MTDSVQILKLGHRVYEVHPDIFIKREVRLPERWTDIWGDIINLPKDSRARLQNEYRMLQYLQKHTKLPVPTSISLTIEDGAMVLPTAIIPNATDLTDLPDDERPIALQHMDNELLTYIIPTLQQHKSHRMGGLYDDEQLLMPPASFPTTNSINHA